MELSNLYDEKYYKEYEFGFRAEKRNDHDRILELLCIDSNKRVLEIGCGFGILLNRIPAKYKIGTESNKTALDECKRRGLSVVQSDAENGLPFEDSSFDIIIMNEVIEHLKNPQVILKECARVLSLNGRIAITTPARNFFVRDLSKTHFSEMTVKQAKLIVENCGFNVLTQEVSGVSFVYPVLEFFCFKPFRWIRNNLAESSNNNPNILMNPKKTIDKIHVMADYFLSPLSYYRKKLMFLGVSQLILAKKVIKKRFSKE